MVSKNVNNKNVLINLQSSMKKNQNDSDDFCCRKLTLKVKFRHFLTPPHYTNLQNSMISFDCSGFLAKKLSNFGISTTDIAIMTIEHLSKYFC